MREFLRDWVALQPLAFEIRRSTGDVSGRGKSWQLVTVSEFNSTRRVRRGSSRVIVGPPLLPPSRLNVWSSRPCDMSMREYIPFILRVHEAPPIIAVLHRHIRASKTWHLVAPNV